MLWGSGGGKVDKGAKPSGEDEMGIVKVRSEGEMLEACKPNGKQSPGGGGVKSLSSGWLGGTRVPCLASRMLRLSAMELEMQRPSLPRSHSLGMGMVYEWP